MTVALIARQVKVAKNSATRFQTHCPAVQLYRYTRERCRSLHRDTKKARGSLASNQHTRVHFLRHLPRSLAMWLLAYPYPPPLDLSVESDDSPELLAA